MMAVSWRCGSGMVFVCLLVGCGSDKANDRKAEVTGPGKTVVLNAPLSSEGNGDGLLVPNDNVSKAIADATIRVQNFESKRLRLEPLLDKALADRDDLVVKLKEAGVNTPADLKGNTRGQQLATSLTKLSTEIDGLELQMAAIDKAVLEAKALVRRMERQQAGISEAEMQKLAEQLKDAEERTSHNTAPATPVDIDAALAKALQGGPKASGGRKVRTSLASQVIGKWDVQGGRKKGTVEFTKGGIALLAWDDGIANALGQRGRSATLKYSVTGQVMKLEEPGDFAYRDMQQMTIEVVSEDELIVIVDKRGMSYDWIQGRLKRSK